MQKPFFSIITCTYSSGKYIGKNILSVEEQTLTDYEHIFVDGNSTDDTRQLINIYKLRDKRVSVYQLEPKGISNAMNEGIRQARGKYLIFLNSDDCFIDSNVLDDVHKYLSSHLSLEWIYGKILVETEDGREIGTFPKRRFMQISSKCFYGKWLIKIFNFVPHQAVFMRKEVFDKFGLFDETITSKMDYDLWLKTISTTRWEYLDRIISRYMVGHNTVSAAPARKKENLDNMNIVQSRYFGKLGQVVLPLLNLWILRVNKIYKSLKVA